MMSYTETDVDILRVRYIAIILSAQARFRELRAHCMKNIEDLREVLYDVLLYAPEAADPTQYIRLLRLIEVPKATRETSGLDRVDRLAVVRSPTTADDDEDDDGDEDTYRNSVQETALWAKDVDSHRIETSTDTSNLRSLTLAQYLEERIRNIDRVTGMLQHAITLVHSFPEQLVIWRNGIFRPLWILYKCKIYQSIDFMEQLDIPHAIAISIGASDYDDLEQILEDVLLPWAKYKNITEELCAAISERMANSSGINLQKVLRILSSLIQSDLDSEQKTSIAAGSMLACYKKPLYADGRDHTAERQTIVAILQNSFKDEKTRLFDLDSFEFSSFDEFDCALQNRNSSLHSLIVPSLPSIALLHEFIDSSVLFNSVQSAVLVRLGSVSVQRQRLAKLLSGRFTDHEIKSLRGQILRQQVLTKIPTDEIEFTILKHLLLGEKADVARKIYITTSPRPLPSVIVEKAILEAFIELFDNAKSLNRKDLNPALLVLAVIHPKHTNMEIRTNQLMIDTLIELSSYQGSQTYLPSQVRRFDAQEVLSFFSRLLQESDNYKRHIRLLGLYQNLTLALKVHKDEPQYRELVVNAALSFDDLETALQLAETLQDEVDEISHVDNGTHHGQTWAQDSWRLNYQVCKYPSSTITVVDRQIFLLSRTLEISPVENLHQLARLYGTLEFAASTSKLRKEQYSHDPYQADLKHHTDRGLDKPAVAQISKIEMPQWRLFEAAQAATRTAREYLPRDSGLEANKTGRIRKRDQIAGIVGSGVGAMESRITSGLGWILGADNSSGIELNK